LNSISSGGEGMAFYWHENGNQLLTKRGTCDGDPVWTTFLMDMKEPTKV